MMVSSIDTTSFPGGREVLRVMVSSIDTISFPGGREVLRVMVVSVDTTSLPGGREVLLMVMVVSADTNLLLCAIAGVGENQVCVSRISVVACVNEAMYVSVH